MKNLFKLIQLVGPYKKAVGLNLFFNVLGMVFSLFSFAMIIPLLRVLFNTNAAQFSEVISKYENPTSLSQGGILEYINYLMATIVVDHGKYYVLVTVCVTLIVVVFFKNLSAYLSSVFLSLALHAVSRDLRSRLHDKVLYLQLSFFSDEKKGDLMSRFTTDVKEVELSLLASINAAFKSPFYIIGYVITLFVINVKLSFFIIVFLPISGLVIALIGKGLKNKAKQGQENAGNLLSSVEESLTGLRIIKGFNAETRTQERFEEKNNSLYWIMIKFYRRMDLASPSSEFLGIVSTAGVLLFGGELVFSGELEPDLFIGYLVLFSQLISPFKGISRAIYEASRGVAALSRIQEITDEKVDIVDKENAIAATTFNDKVEYNNVSFKYEKEYVLKNVNFTLSKGKSIALVGQSGSGKSTLADLLPRFYDIEEGEILLDGNNVKDVTLKSLRDQLGIVTQQSILFNDTVFNNIAFGVESTTEEDVIQAAKIANAHEFIEHLENGYQTNIGDSGGKLSGGQRQRLSIARAVLKNPPILILDEATSALDTESERLVQDALNNLMKNRTSLVIAHRLSTIQHCDEILVMEKGEVKERGNHVELIAQNGVYKRLTEMQNFH